MSQREAGQSIGICLYTQEAEIGDSGTQIDSRETYLENNSSNIGIGYPGQDYITFPTLEPRWRGCHQCTRFEKHGLWFMLLGVLGNSPERRVAIGLRGLYQRGNMTYLWHGDMRVHSYTV